MKEFKGLIAKIKSKEVDPKDEGWRTSKEIQKEDAPASSYSCIRRILAKAVIDGDVQKKKMFNPRLGYSLYHYKEVEELPPIKPPKKK